MQEEKVHYRQKQVFTTSRSFSVAARTKTRWQVLPTVRSPCPADLRQWKTMTDPWKQDHLHCAMPLLCSPWLNPTPVPLLLPSSPCWAWFPGFPQVPSSTRAFNCSTGLSCVWHPELHSPQGQEWIRSGKRGSVHSADSSNLSEKR